MNIHEYQAKIILRKYGIPIPHFVVVSDIEQLKKAIKDSKLNQAVVKVQIHAGGRGKAGGVKFAKTREQILEFGSQMLGMKIVNNQTGPEGIIARKLLISDPVSIKKEFYLGVIIDRQKATALLIASPEGGMDIEEIAEKTPEKVLTLPIRNDGVLKHFQLVRIAKFMGWQGDVARKGIKVVAGLAKAFIETDASLLEINPLVETDEGDIVAVDAKLSVDENALFRQPEIAEFYDATQLPFHEAQARAFDLAYISLEGQIGCMVNGAGLAMATMDIIQYYGGMPANFLDVGGGASQEKVAEGFKLILSDPQVKAVLVNIFGGIMNCVTLAAGIIAAASELQVTVPLIVRMEGTNVEKGKKMLEDSGLNIISADSLADAAEKAVKAIL
jgi:succinyl-CoA synthetase beta subunit